MNHAVSHKTSSSGQRAGGPLTGVTARGGRFQTFRWQELLDPPLSKIARAFVGLCVDVKELVGGGERVLVCIGVCVWM